MSRAEVTSNSMTFLPSFFTSDSALIIMAAATPLQIGEGWSVCGGRMVGVRRVVGAGGMGSGGHTIDVSAKPPPASFPRTSSGGSLARRRFW